MTRQLIVIRTHRADEASLAAYDLFAKIDGFDTIFCVDERNGVADMGSRAKVSFDDATLSTMGLYQHIKAGWRCGDYCYYITRQAHPDYDFYWLIEPDVRINTPDLTSFFAQFATSRADLLAAQYGPRNAVWGWSRTVLSLGLQPFGCLYPLTRLSGRAIDALYAVRRAHSGDPAIAERDAWPNDEAFTASVLSSGDFVCNDLNHGTIRCYEPHTLAVTAVVDYTDVQTRPPDGMIYHPVRDFDAWLAQADKRIGELVKNVRLQRSRATRADASFITGAAQACARDPKYRGVALAPLMVALALWREQPWAATSKLEQTVADAHQAEQCKRMLDHQFGVTRARPSLGSVHLAVCHGQADKLTAAAAEDFELGPGFQIGRLSRRGALPFCYDLDRHELLFTLHLRAHDLLHAPFLYAAQRERARVVTRVPLSSLPDLYGPPDTAVSPVLIFSLGRTGSTLLEKLVSCVTKRAISEPDTATQLSTNKGRLAKLPADQRRAMIYYSIAPFFRLHIPGAEKSRCVIKFRSQVSGLAAEFAETFPKARYVFMIRDRRAWARSTFRAFRMSPEKVADRLRHGSRGLATLQSAGVDLQVLDYDEMVADPIAAVGRLMNMDVAAHPVLAARIHEVMAQDSQASHRLSREKTARAVDGEEEWMAAFEQAWAGKNVV